MPIPTSSEFLDIVSGPHTVKGRVDVDVNGVIVDQLYPISGTVNVDNAQAIRRKCTFNVIDSTGEYTPQGASDRFNPTSGTILRPYSGVEIPSVDSLAITIDTAAQWNTGTLTDITVNSDGSIQIT